MPNLVRYDDSQKLVSVEVGGKTIAIAEASGQISTTQVSTVTAVLSDIPDFKKRATVKGESIAQIGPLTKRNVAFSGADFDIEVVSFNPIEGGVEVFARAWLPGGAQIGFGADGTVDIERFRVFNPTILVPDGTTHLATDSRGNEYQEDNLKEDLTASILNEICHTIKAKKEKFGSENIVVGKIGKTTSTFNPVAGQNSPVDGYCDPGAVNQTFSDIRAAAGAQAFPSGTEGYGGFLEATTSSNQYLTLYRTAFCFDTSAIGDTDTISSATFSLQGVNSFALVVGLGAFECDVVSCSLASTADVTASDFAAANWGTTVFASIASGSITEEGAYNDFSLDANGIANISKTGVSQFGTRLNWDTDNSFGGSWSSAAASGWQVRTADAGVTPPKLVVEHTGLTTASVPTLLTLGVG